MAKRLTITELSSVGGVDDGDNPGASLLFWKRRKRTTPDVGDVTEGVLMDGQTVAVEETEKSDVPEQIEVSAETFAGIVEAVNTADATVEVTVKVADEAEAEAAETAIQVDDLAKSAAEQVAKALAERDAAIGQLAEEVDKRLSAEWFQKAKPFEPLLGPAQEIGPLLRKISEAAPDAFGRLEQALVVALNRADLAKIFGEVGNDPVTADPAAGRDLFVKDMRRLHPEMTVEQARAMFWREHPEAVKASRERI